MILDKKIQQSIIWSFAITILLSGVYFIWYYIKCGSLDVMTQVFDKNFITIDFYSLFLSIFLTIFITIFMYKNDKEDSKEQKYQLDLIKDGTRNHLEDFPIIFAKSIKMIYQIKEEHNYKIFVYVNFFFNFGSVHAIFDENKKLYKKIALNLGLDKLEVDKNKNLDLTNLDEAVIFFNETLWQILENDNKSMFLLLADSNLDLTKSTKYYNKTYEISKVIIKIIMAKNDKRIVGDNDLTFYQNAYNSRTPINTEDEKKDILCRIDKKHLYHDRNLSFIIRVVAYELNKQKLTIKHLSSICKLFNIHFIRGEQDTKKLRALISKDIKSIEDKKEIEKLKSDKFCILEAIYFLLKDVSNKEGIEEQIKRLSLYIQYSKKINQLLEQEFYQRKKLRDKIKNKTIDISKNELYFLKKEHFPHQGILGTFTKNDDRRKSSLIFFISGDTTGSKPKGYYSELNDMYELHYGAFKDIIVSNFEKKG